MAGPPRDCVPTAWSLTLWSGKGGVDLPGLGGCMAGWPGVGRWRCSGPVGQRVGIELGDALDCALRRSALLRRRPVRARAQQVGYVPSMFAGTSRRRPAAAHQRSGGEQNARRGRVPVELDAVSCTCRPRPEHAVPEGAALRAPHVGRGSSAAQRDARSPASRRTYCGRCPGVGRRLRHAWRPTARAPGRGRTDVAVLTSCKGIDYGVRARSLAIQKHSAHRLTFTAEPAPPY
jgi:hypothetical protein